MSELFDKSIRTLELPRVLNAGVDINFYRPVTLDELIENNRLEAVISMPSGVFKPYAGVSTAILIFTKTEHGGTDQVWFYDMTADGFSLDDKRAPIEDNDIPDEEK